jgi:hypothetical protein
MQFHDSESRERYLAVCDERPQQIPYGAAMEHARTTNLGIWGNREALFRDCAEIMAAEIRRFFGEHSGTEHVRVTRKAVASTAAFRAAFNSARNEPEERVNSLLTEAGMLAGNSALVRAATQQLAPEFNPTNLHLTIIAELV